MWKTQFGTLLGMLAAALLVAGVAQAADSRIYLPMIMRSATLPLPQMTAGPTASASATGTVQPTGTVDPTTTDRKSVV